MDYKNLCSRLRIVREQLKFDNQKTMVATVREAIDEFNKINERGKDETCFFCKNYYTNKYPQCKPFDNCLSFERRI
jgi:hypothetical protein